jgi:hypothetical protein
VTYEVDARGAALSPDGVYRYELTRQWSVRGGMVTFVMLNPSTADAMVDDPTIRRCIGFAKREGFGGLAVVNLFALRATDPRELKHHLDPVGPLNEEYLVNAVRESVAVIAAWGANPLTLNVSRAFLRFSAGPVFVLGDRPNHPLYLPGDAQLTRWQP